MATRINPYLIFNGTCEIAFDFYKSVFGGDFSDKDRFENMPLDPKHPISDNDKQKIMHISLPINKETLLMGCDVSEAFGGDALEGNNIMISINTDTVEDGKIIFEKLSEGGVVKMPFDKTFWKAYFGMFTDKFGIHWIINCQIEEKK